MLGNKFVQMENGVISWIFVKKSPLKNLYGN